MNRSKKLIELFEKKDKNIKKGDQVKVNVKAVKGMPEPTMKLLTNIIKKAEGKPVVIRVAADSVDIAESPVAGMMVGTVSVPLSAVSLSGSNKDVQKDVRTDVDATDAIKPEKKKGESLSKKVMSILKK